MDNVIKQGYLKKAHPVAPCQTGVNLATSLKQFLEPSRWYVFGMKGGVPYLEYFEKEESVFTSQPMHSFNLSNCQRISYTLGRTNKNWTFCLFVDDRILELSADSRDNMLAWCRILERTLHEHGRLRKPDSDHVYSEYPVKHVKKKKPPRSPSPPVTLAPPPPIPADRKSRSHRISVRRTSSQGASDDIFSDQASVIFNLRQSHSEKAEQAIAHSSLHHGTGATSNRPLIGVEGEESEPETTGEEDFVTEDFWLSNKIETPPPVPLRTDSIKSSLPSRNASSLIRKRSKDDLTPFRFSVPPLPDRPQSMFVSSTLGLDDQPPEIPSRPVPPPRKSNQNKSDQHAQVQLSLSGDNHRAVSASNSDTMEETCEEQDKRNTLTNKTDIKTTLGNGGLDLDSKNSATNGMSLLGASDSAQIDGEIYDDFILKKEEDDYELNNGDIEITPKVHELDDGYQSITEIKNESESIKCDDDFEDGSYYDTADFTIALREALNSGKSSSSRDSDEVKTPTNNTSYQFPNDYAPFSSTQTSEAPPVPDLPTRNKEYSIADSCQVPEKPPRKKIQSPKSSINPASFPVLTKKPQVQENSSGEKSPSHSPKVAPPRRRNVPPLTEYAFVTRKSNEIKIVDEQPKLPPPRRLMSSPIQSSKSHDSLSLQKRNSPTFDEFQFNLCKSTSTNSDDDDSHEYEDATMLHQKPPKPPPPRITKSYSVNVPPRRSEADCQNYDEDDELAFNTRGNYNRQPSLVDRQRITNAIPGSFNVIPLKQSQVELLQHQQHLQGLQINIHASSGAKIAFVEAYESVWIGGWDMRACPRLNDKLHIGDQVLQVNQVDVSSMAMAHKMFKQCKGDMVEIMLKRLPLGKVYSITRTFEKQPLGIKREGGTAEISYVDPNGLAAAHGLQQKVRSPDGNSECHWCLTEINSRPINITFKAGEMEPLLNAVGKDISFVVQPVTFVKEIKKQLKKLKNYKEFLAL